MAVVAAAPARAATVGTPVFTAPDEGALLNSSVVELRGTADPDSLVEIDEGDVSLGTTTAASLVCSVSQSYSGPDSSWSAFQVIDPCVSPQPFPYFR